MATDFFERCDAIEECYEFLLAYAGQGLPTDSGSQSGSRVRQFLQRAAEAMAGVADSCLQIVTEFGLEPPDKYQAFISVIRRDAEFSLAAFELILAQPNISSQLVDNLNASIHVRALLTDLFVMGEVLRTKQVPAQEVSNAD
ncbi:MAG TPA: hypothetical protein VIW67_20800 [Terriglobales bacterium]|jgi:hypothetical protein